MTWPGEPKADSLLIKETILLNCFRLAHSVPGPGCRLHCKGTAACSSCSSDSTILLNCLTSGSCAKSHLKRECSAEPAGRATPCLLPLVPPLSALMTPWDLAPSPPAKGGEHKPSSQMSCPFNAGLRLN